MQKYQKIGFVQRIFQTIQEGEAKLKILNVALEEAQCKLKSLQQQIEEFQFKDRKIRQKVNLSRIQLDQVCIVRNELFVGEIIEKQSDRQFLISQFTKMGKGNITKTKLLYSFPLMKDLNPHSIDGIADYIILMKFESKNTNGENYLLAMYSEQPLSANGGTNNGKGFIASVTNQIAFYLKKNSKSNPRVTQYNRYSNYIRQFLNKVES